MNKVFIFSICAIFSAVMYAQNEVSFPEAKFQTGNDIRWKDKDFDDRSWATIKTTIEWEKQNYPDYDGYAWYRIHFVLPSSMKDQSYYKKDLLFAMSKIDDVDEVYLNGQVIGKTGSFPDEKEGYASRHSVERYYKVRVDAPFVLWGKENVLALKVYDGASGGGIYGSLIPSVRIIDLIDSLDISFRLDNNAKGNFYSVVMKNTAAEKQKGVLQINMENTKTGEVKTTTEKIQIKPAGKLVTKKISLPYTGNTRIKIEATYTDEYTGKNKISVYVPKYILTPETSTMPRINGAKVFGIRPGSPFLFKIAASGASPMQYEVKNLPKGLSLDAKTGIITGKLDKRGDYTMTCIASNAKGKNEREFTVKVGDTQALTPPMGWNSWNCWGPSVTDAKVRSSAQAMIDKGLINYGWTYINVDDYWESEERLPDGTITGNKNFPDLKGLGDWLHANGLKFGIYSSPGTHTCGGCLGSYQHEALDAKKYAEWGVDYLKYDWCSYNSIYITEGDKSIYASMKPYITMQRQLLAQPRDIVYSLCQYGMKDAWEWAPAVDGNCWRTTGDIVDTWQSLYNIGFSQASLYPYARPGHWNDPDMLIVGMVGWGDHLHPTRLSSDEQYTHISLWCLLASPLLIGCDISQMDDFTLNLLTNSEVIDVNQDPLGKQAQRLVDKSGAQVWVKELEDGSHAVGVFNVDPIDKEISVQWSDIGLPAKPKAIRDLWRQQDISSSNETLTIKVPSHGCYLYKVK
ncbi:Alpha-galactosidase A [termite gut metagenome]|uniref:Alpha-galactosidase A n=1 Tax=termite gut metagenome TaxID=433724 RepID=A0A5J4RUM3_9ZZZZ